MKTKTKNDDNLNCLFCAFRDLKWLFGLKIGSQIATRQFNSLEKTLLNETAASINTRARAAAHNSHISTLKLAQNRPKRVEANETYSQAAHKSPNEYMNEL